MPRHSTITPYFPANLNEYASWVTTYGLVAPYGECQCGCGNDAPIAKKTDHNRGQKKGEPTRYRQSHRGGSESVESVFWFYFKPGTPGTCWEWQGPFYVDGYPKFTVRKKPYSAHRVSYELHHGEIADGLFVCHRCDNRACVNPAHLFLGTIQDNNLDRHSKGRTRGTFQSGENHLNAKLSNADAEAILSLKGSGLLQREVGERYGVSRATIGAIWQGKRYLIRDSAKEAKAALLALRDVDAGGQEA